MIWIVVEGYLYESETIIGVFDSEDKAEELANKKKDEHHVHYPWRHREYYTGIQSWVVE